jgi:type IV secretion system protein VirB1
MDLVTLVTACALGVEPKLMHALVWQQSGGEPWAVSVPNEPMPRVYSSMQQAISETRTASVASGIVRVGLAGLPVASSKTTPAMFLPCRNVAIAAQRIAKLADRCKAHPRLKGDPMLCAVAVYHGSWERPDLKFAEAVTATAAKGDAPNFDMPKGTGIELLDIGSDTTPPPNDPSPGTDSASDERERGWSSALFPPKPKLPESQTKDTPDDQPIAHEVPWARSINAPPFAAKTSADSLFVLRSSGRRPQ